MYLLVKTVFWLNWKCFVVAIIVVVIIFVVIILLFVH